jgi:NDP-sugar pyrophosphorylase family protein
MKAMIFAAGLGTRLRPLTNNKPKALIEIGGKTLLEIVIKRLKLFGIDDIIINIHHFATMIQEYLTVHDNFGVKISFSDEQNQLLDTGGGLKKAEWFFNDGKPFLIHNVDVLSDINIHELYEFHLKHKPLVTLTIGNRQTSRYFLFNEFYQLCGWQNTKSNLTIYSSFDQGTHSPFAFNGVHIIEPKIFDLMTQIGAFSIVDTYLEFCKKNSIIGCFQQPKIWMDLGKIDEIEEARKKIQLLSLDN